MIVLIWRDAMLEQNKKNGKELERYNELQNQAKKLTKSANGHKD